LKFSELIIADLRRLAKRYFTAMSACFLMWGLPYILVIRGCQYLKKSNVIPSGTLDKGITDLIWKTTSIVLIVIVIIAILKKPLDTVKGISKWFSDLGNLLEPFSNLARIIIVLILVTYFVSWFYTPILAYWVGILILIPTGFTYDEFRKIVSARDAGELADKEYD